MIVEYTITFVCRYTLDPDEEEWQVEDDEGKYYFDESEALDRLHDLIRDDPDEYSHDYAMTTDISELKVISR